MNKTIVFLGLFLSLASCNTEKVNLSPVSDLGNSSAYQTTSFTERADQINYASEITNLISTLPKFRNDAVNAEASTLKLHLKDYINGLEDYNVRGKKKALANYQKSYQKLQKLKNYLNLDEAEVLNRYLVRIKTSVTILENQQSKGTITTIND